MVLSHLHLESRPKNDYFLFLKYEENRRINQGLLIICILGFSKSSEAKCISYD
jgi:hypothetical protein